MPVNAHPNLRSLNKEKTHFDTARRIAQEIQQKDPIFLTKDVRQKIVEWFSENKNEGIETTVFKLTLIDPNSKTRIRLPVRSEKCEHFQCFDLMTFLEASLGKKRGNKAQEDMRWLCPLRMCNASAKQELLHIDGFFKEILEKIGPESLEVELFPDGSWRAVEQEDFKVVSVGENDDIAQIVPLKKLRLENASKVSLSGKNLAVESSEKNAQILEDLNDLLGVKVGECPLEAVRLLHQQLQASKSENGKLLKQYENYRDELEKSKIQCLQTKAQLKTLLLQSLITNKMVIFPSVVGEEIEIDEALEGRVLRKLSVIDLLRCERVSPRWKGLVRKFCWRGKQWAFDIGLVFEGATERQWKRFTHEHLISFFHRMGPNLSEFDLRTFTHDRYKPFLYKSESYIAPEFFYDIQNFLCDCLEPFTLQIVRSFKVLTKLKRLDMNGFNNDLCDFVEFLPSTLCDLQISWFQNIDVKSLTILEKLSEKCPKLEALSFPRLDPYSKNDCFVNTFLKFSRLKKLNLRFCRVKKENHAALCQLQQIETLKCGGFDDFDEESFQQVVIGCRSLRKLSLRNTDGLTEKMLFHLANLQNLTVLKLKCDTAKAFTDSVLKALSRRGKLKRVIVANSKVLSDDSILVLIDQCKSLVSLDFSFCPRITERSLEAVIAEVNRRHGSPPETFLTDCHENEVFYFICYDTAIKEEKACQIEDDNPWINLAIYDRTLRNGPCFFESDKRKIM